MGATLETFTFLVYSPVGVEMPRRDPFGTKQRSEPGRSDTFKCILFETNSSPFVTILSWVDNPLGGKSFPREIFRGTNRDDIDFSAAFSYLRGNKRPQTKMPSCQFNTFS